MLDLLSKIVEFCNLHQNEEEKMQFSMKIKQFLPLITGNVFHANFLAQKAYIWANLKKKEKALS
jgi:hypothetical protein